MGPQEDYIETVVTCEGDFHDPQLQERLQRFQQRLERLLLQDGQNQLILKKVEPWNSVRVTFNIPREAALRLKQLAEQGNAALRQLGVLGVQIEGDRLVSLTVQTHNNQRAELVFNTSDGPVGHAAAAAAVPQHGAPSMGAVISFDGSLPSSSEEPGSPGPNMEVTRKNIEEYLRQINSLLPAAVGAGPSGAGPSSDIFKMPSHQNVFRPNNIGGDGMPGPSGLSGYQSKSDAGVHGPGALVSTCGSGRGPRGSSHHQRHHQKQQQHQQQQFASQATALPQTAAVGLGDLPPPPPYPLGGSHRTGVVNNVGRQGKKASASSPLLINLLQTDPMASANNVIGTVDGEKPVKKKRRKRKDKQSAAATSTSEDQATIAGSRPMDTAPVLHNFPQSSAPATEQMSSMLNRRVSPIPLPSPRIGTSFNVPMPPEVVTGNDGFRDRPSSMASAALASLAQSQRAVEPDTIINPYTGQLEPRDSASDLSPVKKDQHKSHADFHPMEISRKDFISVSAAEANAESTRNEMVDSSFHPAAMREDRNRGYSSGTVTSASAGGSSTQLQKTNTSLPQRPGLLLHNRAASSPSTTMSASTQHYAPHYGPSQMMPHASHPSPQHSTHPALPTVNGPISASLQTSLPYTVPSGQDSRSQVSGATMDSVDSRVRVSGLAMESVNPYHPASHRPLTSVRTDSMHSVSAGESGVGVRQQTVTTAGLISQVSSVVDIRQGAGKLSAQLPVSASLLVTASDSHNKLLNSTSSSTLSPAPAGRVQRLIAENAVSVTTTASPSGSKPSSDGDDNSNHSGTSPVGPTDSAMAPSSLLDANGTKADNHDSGVGSSSERSEDTTPSEAGDGEFQTHITSEAADSGRHAVNMPRPVLNCKKEGPSPGSADPHNITVGYVHMNQQTNELYHKETRHHLTNAPLSGDKVLSNESIHQMTRHIKSSTSVHAPASQVTQAAHKQLELSRSVPSKVSSPQLGQQSSLAQQQQQHHQQQHERLMMKHKALPQSSSVYQNGPLPATPAMNPQLPAVLRLPATCQPPVMHHPAAMTTSQAQGGRLPFRHHLSTAPVKVPLHHPSGGHGGHQPTGAAPPHGGLGPGVRPHSMHHQAGIGGPGQHLHPLPSSIPSSRGAESFNLGPSPVPGLLASQSSSHIATSAQGLQHSSTHGAAGSAANSQTIQRTASMPLSNYPGHSVSAQGYVGQGNGLPPSHNAPGIQHMGVPQSPGHNLRTPSPSTHPSLRPPSHGPSAQMLPLSHGSYPGGGGGQNMEVHSQAMEQAVSRTMASPMHQAKPSIDVAASNALATAHGMAPLSKTGHNSFYSITSSSVLPLVSMATDSRGFACATDQDGGMASVTRQGSPRLGAFNPHNLPSSISKSPIAHDLDSMASSLDFLEASFHPDEGIFSPDDDLALLSDSGFFTGHAATNGSGGVSTETRSGSNITSMYAKRSSPINVNMLNHMYAAGLPQPRRLTESVQRLVKPLPNPENALPPGARACKSPGSSGSRHSSNGSASPGRATQGGARSPGANVSPSPSSRAERLASSPSAYPLNSGIMGGGYPPVYHSAQAALSESMVNCINTPGVSVALHPLSSIQSPISRQKGNMGQGCVASQSGMAVIHSGASTALTPTFQPASASLSTFSLPTSLTLSDGATSVVMSHLPVPSHDVVPAHAHSTGAAAATTAVSPTSDPSATSFHSSPPLPALVSLSHEGGMEVSKSPSVPSIRVTPQATAPAVPLHTHAMPHSHVHYPSVSVCNTSSVVDSTSVAVAVSSLSSSPSVLQSVSQHGSSTTSSLLKPPPLTTYPVHPQSDLSTPVIADNPHSASTEKRTVGMPNPTAANISVSSGRGMTVNQSSVQQISVSRAEMTHNCSKVDTLLSSTTGTESTVRTGEIRTIHSGYTYSHIAVSAQPETRVTCVPVSQTVPVSGFTDSCTRQSSISNSDCSKTPVEEELSVPKLENALETELPALVRKEKERGRIGGLTPLSMPALSAQDLTQQSAYQGESPHSKPPLLHPTTPFISTFVPSATPPPPPLTPVLPNDPGRKEGQGHNTPPPSVDGHVYPATVFGTRELTRTASPLATESQSAESGDGSDGVEKMTIDASQGDTTFVETNGSKLDSADPKLTELASEDGSLKMRRLTRKRKPTLSESDSSSSEPAPKITCLESAPVSGLSRNAENSKTGTMLDHPPKLQREGKRSSERKEEERGVRKEEDRWVKKEDGKGLRTKDESNKVVIEDTGVPDDDRENKEDDQEGKEEEKDGSKPAEKSAKHTKDSRVLDATPEEVAQKMAASGGKRRFYTYVPENKLNDSFFDVKLLPARTRNQGKAKDGAAGPSATATATGATSHTGIYGAGQQSSSNKEKEESGEAAAHGGKRATRQRNKDPGEGGQNKRKRVKEHR